MEETKECILCPAVIPTVGPDICKQCQYDERMEDYTSYEDDDPQLPQDTYDEGNYIF